LLEISLAQTRVAGNWIVILPFDGIGFVVVKRKCISLVRLTIFEAKDILISAKLAGAKFNDAIEVELD
jgi:hypothetical protein